VLRKDKVTHWPLESQSPAIIILNTLTGQTKSLHNYMVLWTVPHSLPLTTTPRGLDAEVLTGWIPFLSPNQHCRSTEENFVQLTK